MKLLFDQNLSPKLADFFAELFAESKHLQDLNLDIANDSIVWEFAKKEGFTIVTKDNDFNNLVAYFGFPPKVIWIRRGNCSTNDIKNLLSSNTEKIKAFIIVFKKQYNKKHTTKAEGQAQHFDKIKQQPFAKVS